MAIRAVSFDFHGTLASVYPSPGAIYQRVAAEFGIEADGDDLSRHFGPAFRRVRQSHEIPYGCDESDARGFLVRGDHRLLPQQPGAGGENQRNPVHGAF